MKVNVKIIKKCCSSISEGVIVPMLMMTNSFRGIACEEHTHAERERERERDTHTQTERQRVRQRQRQNSGKVGVRVELGRVDKNTINKWRHTIQWTLTVRAEIIPQTGSNLVNFPFLFAARAKCRTPQSIRSSHQSLHAAP